MANLPGRSFVSILQAWGGNPEAVLLMVREDLEDEGLIRILRDVAERQLYRIGGITPVRLDLTAYDGGIFLVTEEIEQNFARSSNNPLEQYRPQDFQDQTSGRKWHGHTWDEILGKVQALPRLDSRSYEVGPVYVA